MITKTKSSNVKGRTCPNVHPSTSIAVLMTSLSRHGSALGAQFDLDRHSVRREYQYMALFIQAFQERMLDMLDAWLDSGVILVLGQRGCMHDGASHKVTATEQKRKQMFGLGVAPRLLALNECRLRLDWSNCAVQWYSVRAVVVDEVSR